MKKKIAIIGAGYTGLTIGYRLTQAGFDVTIYEKENCVGGLAAGLNLDGLPLEKIWHFIYMSDNEVIGLAEELGVKNSLVFHDSSVSTYYGGKLYPFRSPLDLLRFTPLSFFDRIRMGLVGLYLQNLKNWKPLTKIVAYRWMLKWAGKDATRVVWEPLLRGKFGKYFDKVTMSWLWKRIKVRVDSKGKEGGERLGYFKGGFLVITEGMKDSIEKNGGKIITGAYVEKIIRNSDGSVIVESGENSDKFDSVAATTPSHVFAKLVKGNDGVTKEYLEKLTSIDYIGAVVMVFTSNQKISPYYWHNVNDPEIPFLVFLSNTVLAGEETYQGKNVYYVGFYADHSHPYFSQDENEIMRQWEDGLKKMFPDFDPTKLREKRLFKFQNAQHIVDVGYEEKIPPYECAIPNVYLSNFSQIYPDDRGLNFAIREGNKIAQILKSKVE